MKSRRNQCRALVLFVTILFFTLPVAAQVTIGSQNLPSGDALLDLRQNTTDSSSTKGLLLPRVALSSTSDATPLSAHVKGMFVYNTATTTAGSNDVTPGIYYNDGTKWIKEEDDQVKWFYMPSFNFPITTPVGQETSFNLYNEYVRQFTASGNDQFISSNTGAANVEPLYTAEELEYYVTAYPDDVIHISGIDHDGNMTYTVLSENVPEGAFINVIFKVK